jgi:hypothetical protein
MTEREGTSKSGSDVSTRRDLLRVFARNARERAQEVAPLIREVRLSMETNVLGRSLRMTSTDPAGADAWILTSDEWVVPGDTDTLVAQIDLAAAAAHELGLPADGWLVLFVGPVGPSDTSMARRARGVVLDAPAEVRPDLQPAKLGAELVMPRLWHEAVQQLELEGGSRRVRSPVRARA